MSVAFFLMSNVCMTNQPRVRRCCPGVCSWGVFLGCVPGVCSWGDLD